MSVTSSLVKYLQARLGPTLRVEFHAQVTNSYDTTTILIMSLLIMTLLIMTLCIMTLCIMTLLIMTLLITTLLIVTLLIMAIFITLNMGPITSLITDFTYK
jgi:hypothetical protein